MSEKVEMECKKCGAEMKTGKAIVQTLTGLPDFIGCSDVVTVSPGGGGKLIDCLKCCECGWSVTGAAGTDQQERGL